MTSQRELCDAKKSFNSVVCRLFRCRSSSGCLRRCFEIQEHETTFHFGFTRFSWPLDTDRRSSVRKGSAMLVNKVFAVELS